MTKKYVKIELKEYLSLKEAELKLIRLENGGVDNWQWYGDSLYPKGEPEIDDLIDEIEKTITIIEE